MCLISDIMNGAIQPYIGFPLMSVCCKNCTLEESTSEAISQVQVHHLERLWRGGTCRRKKEKGKKS